MKISLTIIAGLMAAAVFAAPASPSSTDIMISEASDRPFTISQAAQTASDAILSMDRDSEGSIQVGGDGVARSLAANGTVIDFRNLSEFQVESMTGAVAPLPQDKAESARDVAADVDGNGPPQSVNPNFKRQSYAAFSGLYCKGAKCSTSRACEIMGCAACISMPRYKNKVCF